MADKPPMLPPASEPFPGSRTPGWNDPPTLQFNPLAAPAANNAGRQRLNLNKRVAFPLQGMGAASTTPAAKPTAIVQPNQGVMPPMPPTMTLPPSAANSNHPIAVVHPMPNMNVPPSVAARVPPPTGMPELPHDAQQITFQILREQTVHVPESLNVRREELDRRLGLLEQLWQSGHLSAAVQQKVYHLTQAITQRSFQEAMDTYTAIVLNHSNECANWAVALRHIVLTIQPVGVAAATDATAVVVNTNEGNVAAVPPMFVPMTASQQVATPYHTNADASTARGHSNVQHI